MTPERLRELATGAVLSGGFLTDETQEVAYALFAYADLLKAQAPPEATGCEHCGDNPEGLGDGEPCPSCHGQGCEPHECDDGRLVQGPDCQRCGGSGKAPHEPAEAIEIPPMCRGCHNTHWPHCGTEASVVHADSCAMVTGPTTDWQKQFGCRCTCGAPVEPGAIHLQPIELDELLRWHRQCAALSSQSDDFVGARVHRQRAEELERVSSTKAGS